MCYWLSARPCRANTQVGCLLGCHRNRGHPARPCANCHPCNGRLGPAHEVAEEACRSVRVRFSTRVSLALQISRFSTHAIHRVPAAAIARLVFLRRLVRSPDLTYDSLAYSIATQCQTTLTVVVACIPALKPFMDRAASGMMAVSLEPRSGTYGNPNSYAMRSLSKGHGTPSKKRKGARLPDSKGSQNGTTTGPETTKNRSFRPDHSEHEVVISAPNAKQHKRDTSMDGAASDKFMIQKTTAWDVKFEDDTQQQQHHHRRPSHDTSPPDMVSPHSAV